VIFHQSGQIQQIRWINLPENPTNEFGNPTKSDKIGTLENPEDLIPSKANQAFKKLQYSCFFQTKLKIYWNNEYACSEMTFHVEILSKGTPLTSISILLFID